MIIKKKLSKWQLKTAFEYFNSLVNQPGITPTYSLFVAKNHDLLAPHYMGLSKLIYNEANDPENFQYRQEVSALQEKYAARDEQGNILRDDKGNMHLDGNHTSDFNTELETINAAHKDLLARIQNKNAINNEIYNQLVELDVYGLTLSEFVNDAPPFIVGAFVYGIEPGER